MPYPFTFPHTPYPSLSHIFPNLTGSNFSGSECKGVTLPSLDFWLAAEDENGGMSCDDMWVGDVPWGEEKGGRWCGCGWRGEGTT